MTKHSPCCKATIVKRKRYGGQITLDYCKKCRRRVWPGNKSVTRAQAYELMSQTIEKIKRKKPERQEKFFDIFVRRVAEEYEGR